MPNRQHNADEARTAENLALTVIETNQRWWALQIEAMEAALAESAEHSRAMLESASTTAETLWQWPNLYQGNVQRHTDLTRIGLEIAAQTFVQFNDLLGHLLWSSLAGTEALKGHLPRHAAAPEGIGERRITARVIFFPDRRKSLANTDEAAETNTHSELSQRGRKRKQA